jgi:uncharacterized protein (UPF0332 family)
VSDEGEGEIARETIDRELELSRQMLADAEKAHEVGISKATIVNRLYYACFHAAQAALYSRGFNPQSHGSVQTLLGRELIKSGPVKRDFGRFFNDMETYRRRVDYGSGSVEPESNDLIAETRKFRDAMRSAIEESTD